MKAIGLVRVSTTMQASEGVSLEAQAAKIRAYCAMADLDLVEIIVEAGKSGKAGGNGSLMRTLPVALAYGPQERLMLHQAARLSAMTHWDSQAETACIVYCLWVENILEGHTLQSGWDYAVSAAKVHACRSGETAEFPGGKCLPGEEPAICASRECLEETGLCVVPVRELMQVEHEYPHGLLSLHFWLCRPEADDAVRVEHRGFAWVPADGLANQRFPEANREVVEMLISGQR